MYEVHMQFTRPRSGLGVAMNATNIEAYALAKGLDFTWKTATQAEKAEVAM